MWNRQRDSSRTWVHPSTLILQIYFCSRRTLILMSTCTLLCFTLLRLAEDAKQRGHSELKLVHHPRSLLRWLVGVRILATTLCANFACVTLPVCYVLKTLLTSLLIRVHSRCIPLFYSFVREISPIPRTPQVFDLNYAVSDASDGRHSKRGQ